MDLKDRVQERLGVRGKWTKNWEGKLEERILRNIERVMLMAREVWKKR